MKTWLLAVLAISMMWGCPEDDPVENGATPTTSNNSSTTNNSPTSNNTTTTNNAPTSTPLMGCEASCAGLADSEAFAARCSEGLEGFDASCASACQASTPAFSDFAAEPGLGLGPALERAGVVTNCSFSCTRDASDYTPGADDTWDACISDAGTYSQILDSISSIGRVQGYEQIADLLWRIEGEPSSEAFISARDIYATGEGLDSRVQRREDEHYPPVTDGQGNTLRCRDEGVPEQDPDRCVGPAKILPILTDAFQKGIQGESPRIQAARLDAALLWFLYVSTHKEAVTCTNVAKDCDSSYAYYSGGQPRSEGIGLAGVMRAQSPLAHDYVWDGILAVRCWRDLDPEEVATNIALRDTAIAQLDRGLLYGMARMVQDRTAQYAQHSGVEADADWAWLAIMYGVLDRAATERDATNATTLRGLVESRDAFDPAAASSLLDEIFACP